VSTLEPLAWDEVCKVIENPETVLNELRGRQGRAAALDEEIERIEAAIKALDAQKQRALRLFTIAEADDADVKRELARINKLHGQARARLADMDGRRAVSAQFEPMAEKVRQFCELMRDRLNELSFEQKARSPGSASGAVHARERWPVEDCFSSSERVRRNVT